MATTTSIHVQLGTAFWLMVFFLIIGDLSHMWDKDVPYWFDKIIAYRLV